MGIDASYHLINAAEWDRLRQLQQSNPPLPVRWKPEVLTP
jgi:hypothetical protein